MVTGPLPRDTLKLRRSSRRVINLANPQWKSTGKLALESITCRTSTRFVRLRSSLASNADSRTGSRPAATVTRLAKRQADLSLGSPPVGEPRVGSQRRRNDRDQHFSQARLRSALRRSSRRSGCCLRRPLVGCKVSVGVAVGVGMDEITHILGIWLHSAAVKAIWLAICAIEDNRSRARETERGPPSPKRKPAAGSSRRGPRTGNKATINSPSSTRPHKQHGCRARESLIRAEAGEHPAICNRVVHPHPISAAAMAPATPSGTICRTAAIRWASRGMTAFASPPQSYGVLSGRDRNHL